jgi:hypothetical protein
LIPELGIAIELRQLKADVCDLCTPGIVGIDLVHESQKPEVMYVFARALKKTATS